MRLKNEEIIEARTANSTVRWSAKFGQQFKKALVQMKWVS